MNKIVTVAVLGSTGYVGLELIKIIIKHPNIKINFLGSESFQNKDIGTIDPIFTNLSLPILDLNNNFDPLNTDLVFLALPHGVSHKYVNKYFDKIKIIDLSADFRLDSEDSYSKNYNNDHSCINLLNQFIYGLPEINKDLISLNSNIAIPGCYPTSILTPLIPLFNNDLLNTDNIVIDSKSGYSGAGRKFDNNNIKNSDNLNFYNYNTNNHRHICEIQQELNKHAKNNVNFSFNPHILPNFRGMMSTIYCDINFGITQSIISDFLEDFCTKLPFVNFLANDNRADFFLVQNTNNCFIKLFNHQCNDKIIIVSIIDNLIKGAAGQAVQCFNIMFNLDQKISLEFK